MEIIGKVVRIGSINEGTSARGAWRKAELIIETIEQYPKTICLICWNDKVAEAQNFVMGQMIKAQISIESREFNGKWYTDVRAFRFDLENGQNQQPAPAPAPAQSAPMQTTAAPSFDQGSMMTNDYFESDNGDDLPF